MSIRWVALVSALLLFVEALATDSLPDLRASTARISVSGLSSGAAMATQLSVAYSDRVEGVGLMAGPPYLCAQASSRTALMSCLIMPIDLWGITIPDVLLPTRDDIDLDNLIADTRAFARQGSIPPLSNLSAQRVWVSRGQRDEVVGPNATQAVRAFYETLGAKLAPVEAPNVPHTLPTDKPGLALCDRNPDPNFVSSCNIDSVGRMFEFLFGWKPAERGQARPEHLLSFDQTPYTFSNSISGRKRPPAELSMAQEGRVYIPATCRQGGCKVHVAIHGCQQGKDTAFNQFTRMGGFNDWAESNRLIVLFPRVIPMQSIVPYVENPRGCWDWWGYTPDDTGDWTFYAKPKAPQMRAIMNMVDALAGRAPQ